MTTLITYNIVSDLNDHLKAPAKIACNFWNDFLEPNTSIVIRLGIFTADTDIIARAYTPSTSGGVTYGRVEFNTKFLKDYSKFQIAGTIIHELGHILGIGFDKWMHMFDVKSGRFYSEYIDIVPGLKPMLIELEGGVGTQYYHWDEKTYDKELMTGYKEAQEHVLPVTIDVMSLFHHRIIKHLPKKTDLDRLMAAAEQMKFIKRAKLSGIDLEHFEETTLFEEVYASNVIDRRV